jgi:hypothetical protein
MGLIAKHMGKLGDILMALPCIKALGIEILYIPETTAESSALHSNIKDLLQLQPYIKEVREYPSGLAYREKAPGIHIDVDLDDARLQPNKGLIHIVKRYLDAFCVNLPNWKEPWLVVDDVRPPIQGEYTVINYTGRHITNDQLQITSRIDWSRVVASMSNPVFVGTGSEHIAFCKKFDYVPYLYTANMLEVARAVKHATAVYCNQSSVLALSQAIGVEYHLEVKPHKRNCLLETKNEYILL